MLQSLPMLLVWFGTPVAVLALIPAHLVWTRLMRGRTRALSALYLTPEAARRVVARVSAVRLACVAGVGVVPLVALAVVLYQAPVDADPRVVAVAGALAAGAGLVVMLSWPWRRGEPRGEVDVPVSRPEGRLALAVGALALATILVCLVAGLASTSNPASHFYDAYPQASVMEWFYDWEGRPTGIEYTPNGVTTPWPGWYYGVPVMLSTTVLVGLLAAVLVKVRSWRAVPVSEAHDLDDTVRMLVALVAGALTAAALCFELAFLLAMAGDVLTSVTLYPLPRSDWRSSEEPVAFHEPLHALGLAASWSWILLGLATVVLFWLAVFATGGLHQARRACRRALAAS